MAVLTPEDFQRYDRQIALPEFGLAGQQRLKAGRVLIVGVGGLGSPAALYLTAMGVGRLTLVDHDTIALSNLQRQILYSPGDVGKPKPEVAQRELAQRNAELDCVIHQERLNESNATALVSAHDVVIDGTDDLATRRILNRACVQARIPLVYGALHRFEGVLSVFCGSGEDSPCYACLHGDGVPGSHVTADCATGGVLGVLPGIIGTLQAAEAVKLIARVGEPLTGRLLSYDALTTRFREWKLPQNSDCPVCGEVARASGASMQAPQPANPGSAQSRVLAVDTSTRDGSVDSEHPDRSISVQTLRDRLRDGSLRLLDVREAHEHEISSIAGAQRIPLGELSVRLGELDRAESYAVICKSGVRSLRAISILQAAGFERLQNVTGGINAWAEHIDPSLPRY